MFFMDNIKNALIENVMNQSIYPGVLPFIVMFILSLPLGIVLFHATRMTPMMCLLLPIVSTFVVFGSGIYTGMKSNREIYLNLIKNMKEDTRYLYDYNMFVSFPYNVEKVSGEVDTAYVIENNIPFKFISISKDRKSVFLEFETKDKGKSVFEWPVETLFPLDKKIHIREVPIPDNTPKARFINSTY